MTIMKNDIELSGTQFMYDQPEALHSGVHGGLKFVADTALFVKAEGIHIVPLLVGEFVQAMMHYPIVFGGPERTPMAIMGLKGGENMFVKNGRFEDGVYVPAYLRRYPFTLAGAGPEDFVVCIDRNAPGFVECGTGQARSEDEQPTDFSSNAIAFLNEIEAERGQAEPSVGCDEGQALFEDGQPTDFTRNAIAFLNEFETERKRTRALVDLLVEADILEVKHTMFVAAATGERELIADYYGVAEEKLRELADDKLAELVKRGAMTAVDAHLMSLQRWDALIARRDAVVDAAPAAEEAAPVDQEEQAVA